MDLIIRGISLKPEFSINNRCGDRESFSAVSIGKYVGWEQNHIYRTGQSVLR